jgi:hypothetical protein
MQSSSTYFTHAPKATPAECSQPSDDGLFSMPEAVMAACVAHYISHPQAKVSTLSESSSFTMVYL